SKKNVYFFQRISERNISILNVRSIALIRKIKSYEKSVTPPRFLNTITTLTCLNNK
ncbi:hypothetical protein L9F63_011238, partial [Diploptera punctata]